MTSGWIGGPVLVAIKDPEHVQQLVRTAGDLAAIGDGRVQLVTVIAKPHDSPFGIFDDETIVREYSDEGRALLQAADPPSGVTVDRRVVVARSVARGLRHAVDDADPAALLVGWEGPRRATDAVLGTTVDALIDRVSCDLYVERIGLTAGGVDSILLPVAGGPHVAAAARMAAAIALGNDASVEVTAVAAGETDRAAASAHAAAGRDTLRAVTDDVPVEATVRSGERVTDALVGAAADHDVVVFGATRQGSLRRRLVGSVPRRVVARTDTTVILGRDGDVVTGALGRVGRLLRQ